MAQVLKIEEVEIARQGGAYHYTGDDGYPAAVVVDEVHVRAEGRWFVLPGCRAYSQAEIDAACREGDGEPPYGPKVVYWPHEADALAAKIKARGFIRPQFWVEYEPDTRSLEQKFADYAYEEALERYRETGRVI